MSAKIRIANIFPDIYTESLKGAKLERQRLAESVREQTGGLVELETIFVDKGLASIETCYDEAINTPFVLDKVRLAQEQGYDAVTIDCMGDPGLDAARELVDIPVLGACESSVHLASILGKRFSVINVLRETEFLIGDLVRKYGLESNLASMRTINIPVLELEKDPDKTTKLAQEAALRIVEEDRAGAIVLGCTGMAGMNQAIETFLKERGHDVPVLDGLKVAIYTAIMVVLTGKKQSKDVFRFPTEKPKRL